MFKVIKWFTGALLICLTIQFILGDLFAIQIIFSGLSKGILILGLIFGGSILLSVFLTPLYLMWGGFFIGIKKIKEGNPWWWFPICYIGGIVLAEIIGYISGLIIGYIFLK